MNKDLKKFVLVTLFFVLSGVILTIGFLKLDADYKARKQAEIQAACMYSAYPYGYCVLK